MQMMWRRELFDTQDGIKTLLGDLLDNAEILKEKVSEHGCIQILAEVANFLAQFGDAVANNHVPLQFVHIALGWANEVGKKYSISELGTATDRKAMEQLAERYNCSLKSKKKPFNYLSLKNKL
jgi:hypothetical protein